MIGGGGKGILRGDVSLLVFTYSHFPPLDMGVLVFRREGFLNDQYCAHSLLVSYFLVLYHFFWIQGD